MTAKRVTISPTVTAHSADEFRRQMEHLAGFATRVHIDITDGAFTEGKALPFKDVWWPGGVRADIHMMYREPLPHTMELLKLRPQLIIAHAEAKGDFERFSNMVHYYDVAVGVALKPETPIQLIEPALDRIDHVLIISGHTGRPGGHANTHLLTKVLHLKRLKPGLEIGWEGGVTAANAAILAAGGVDVLNVGSAIRNAAHPHMAYEHLEVAARHLPASHRRV